MPDLKANLNMAVADAKKSRSWLRGFISAHPLLTFEIFGGVIVAVIYLAWR